MNIDLRAVVEKLAKRVADLEVDIAVKDAYIDVINARLGVLEPLVGGSDGDESREQ